MSEPNTASCFIDTNVWLYAFIESQDQEKARLAKQLIEEHRPAISTQVINEVCVNLRRQTDVSESQIRELIVSFYHRYDIFGLDSDILIRASHLRGQYALSFWDSLIVASALRSNSSLLYTEDMQDGLVVEQRLTIVNPFKKSTKV